MNLRRLIAAAILCIGCTEKTVSSSSESTPTNEPPQAIVNSPFPGQEIPNGAFFVAWGEVSDSEDEPENLQVSWTISGEERCEPGPPTELEGRTKCEVSFSFDKQNITMRVTDTTGESSEQTIEIRVVENTGPAVTITSPLPGAAYRTTDVIPFEGTVMDGEDTPEGLAVWWESDQGDLLNEIGQTVTSDGRVTGSGHLNPGQHIVRLFAVDTSGRQGEANVSITIYPPAHAPEVNIESPLNGAHFASGSLINFVAQVTDEMTPYGELTVEWASNRETGILNTDAPATDGTVQFSTDSLSDGEHAITLTATDADGDHSTDTIVIQVGGTDTGSSDTGA
jgi:hypothetical protein